MENMLWVREWDVVPLRASGALEAVVAVVLFLRGGSETKNTIMGKCGYHTQVSFDLTLSAVLLSQSS